MHGLFRNIYGFGVDDLKSTPLKLIDDTPEKVTSIQTTTKSSTPSLARFPTQFSSVELSSHPSHSSSQVFQLNTTDTSHSKLSALPSPDTDYDDIGMDFDFTEEEWKRLDLEISAKYDQIRGTSIKQDVDEEKPSKKRNTSRKEGARKEDYASDPARVRKQAHSIEKQEAADISLNDTTRWNGITVSEYANEENCTSPFPAPTQNSNRAPQSKPSEPRIIYHCCASIYSPYDDRMWPRDLPERLKKKRRANPKPFDQGPAAEAFEYFRTKATGGIPHAPHKRKRSEFEAECITPIQAFFAQYPDFTYISNGETMEQFIRLCIHMDWVPELKPLSSGGLESGPSQKKRQLRDAALNQLQEAIAEQFNICYGVDDDDLRSWHVLLEVCGVSSPPTTVEECKKTINSVHVNICDLADSPMTGKPPKLFLTEFDLSVYSKSTGKIYPRSNVKARALLRYLLRHINDPKLGWARGQGQP